MEIYPLSEGSFTVGRTKQFVPFDVDHDRLQDRPAGSLLVEVQPFLVKMKNELVLLDTGLGFSEPDGELQIHHNIRRMGFSPLDVSTVLISHLHKDHSGALVVKDSTANETTAFKNATYYIYRNELDFALSGKSSSYVPSQYEHIRSSSQLSLLEGIGEEIKPGIYFQHTGAHSPEHIVFRLVEDGQIFFFGGDVAPQLQQMKNKFIAKYDYDGRKSMQLRSAWWERGKSEHWTFMFYHDIKFPTYKFDEKK